MVKSPPWCEENPIVEQARQACRLVLWQFVTPYRLGLLLGACGYADENPYVRGRRGYKLFEDGVRWVTVGRKPDDPYVRDLQDAVAAMSPRLAPRRPHDHARRPPRRVLLRRPAPAIPAELPGRRSVPLLHAGPPLHRPPAGLAARPVPRGGAPVTGVRVTDDKINFVQVTGHRDAMQPGLDERRYYVVRKVGNVYVGEPPTDEQRAAFAEWFRRWMEKKYIP